MRITVVHIDEHILNLTLTVNLSLIRTSLATLCCFICVSQIEISLQLANVFLNFILPERHLPQLVVSVLILCLQKLDQISAMLVLELTISQI